MIKVVLCDCDYTQSCSRDKIRNLCEARARLHACRPGTHIAGPINIFQDSVKGRECGREEKRNATDSRRLLVLCCTLFNSTHYCTVTHTTVFHVLRRTSLRKTNLRTLFFSASDAPLPGSRELPNATRRKRSSRASDIPNAQTGARTRGISLVTSVTLQCKKYARVPCESRVFFFVFFFVHKFLEHFGEQSRARNRILKRH